MREAGVHPTGVRVGIYGQGEGRRRERRRRIDIAEFGPNLEDPTPYTLNPKR